MVEKIGAIIFRSLCCSQESTSKLLARLDEERRCKTFSDRIKKGDFLVGCGVSDTLSAKIVEEAGFDAIWLGSLVGTASALGGADIGLMTPTERINQVLKIKSVSSLPVIVDGEEGW